MDAMHHTADDRLKIIRQAESCGNIRAVCEAHRISRTLFYRWKRRLDEDGPAGLIDRAPITREHPSRTPDRLRKRVIALALQHPSAGSRAIADLICCGGESISAVTVNKLLRESGLETRRARWLALEHTLFVDNHRLSAEQLAFVEAHNPNVRDRELRMSSKIKSLCAGHFRVLSRSHRQLARIAVVIDTWSGYAHACANRSSFGPSAYGPLSRVATIYKDIGCTVQLVLTRDSEIAECSRTSLYLGMCEIAVRRIPTSRLGCIETFHRTLGRDSDEALAAIPKHLTDRHHVDGYSLTHWVSRYNETAYEGFPNFGRSPAAMFADACKQGALTNGNCPSRALTT